MSLPPPPRSSDPPPAVAEFVRRVRGSDDARARLLRPSSSERRDALADRWMASKGMDPSSDAPRARPLRRAGIMLAFAAALAAAAAGIVIPRLESPAPVASWTVQGEQRVRGSGVAVAGDSAVIVRPDTLIRLQVSLDRPADEVKFRLLLVRDGDAVDVPVKRKTIEGDVLHVEQRAEDALGPQTDGAAELVWVGGLTAPDEAEAVRLATGKAPARGFVVLRRAVVFEGWQKTGSLDLGGGASGDVEITGCVTMTRDGVCEVGEQRTVTIWGSGRPRVLVDDQPAASADPVAIDGGMRVVVSLPEGARALIVSTGAVRRRFSLGDGPSASARLARATAAVRDDKLDEAEAMLSGPDVEASPGLRAERLAERRLLARIARRRAAAGQIPMARAQEERLAVGRAAAEAGRLSEAADDLLATAFLKLTDTGDFAGAKALLDEAEGGAALTADSRVFWEYLRGIWARETGDLGAALDDLLRARARAARLDLRDLAGDVATALPEVLALLGRVDEALAMSPAPSGQGCDAAIVATNRGWARLIGGGDVHVAAGELRGALDRAGGRCREHEPLMALNLSYAEEARGNVDEAAKWLSVARGATRPGDARLTTWHDRLEIQLALSGAPALALQAAERLARGHAAKASPEVRFEAAFGRARALRALGRVDEVGPAFHEAEVELDAWVRTAHLGQGRDSLLARFEAAPRAWLSWFVDQAEHAERAAPAVGRAAAERLLEAQLRSLSRGIRTLSPATGPEPSVPPPVLGELRLLIHPLAAGVLVTAWTTDRLSFVRLPRPTGAPVLVAQALLAPFEAELELADRVQLLVHRAFAGLPFGAVDIGGRVLGEIAPLSYSLGIAPAAEDAPGRPQARPRAVVVLDPRGDLDGARRSMAARDLEQRGFDVVVLRGQDATRGRVIEALQSACGGLFHYEGHGAHRGIDGNGAGLLLADGDLEVRRLRELRCAPRTVVLAACDTAHPSGFALAHAFVERGATAVLGAAATLDDTVAAEVMKRLYTSAPAAEPFDLPAAVTVALRELRGAGVPVDVDVDVAGLRVLVP